MPLELPSLPQGVALFDTKTGAANSTLIRWWSLVIAGVSSETGALEAAAAAQAAATAANAAAATAQAAATTANGAATAAATATTASQALQNLINSTVTAAGTIITAADVGANVTVSIAAHNRIYGDNTTVAVNAGTVTGQAYSASLHIYYDQASRAGGAVTYLATTSIATAKPSTTQANRHYVGAVLTPAALGAATDGSQALYPQFEFPDPGFNYI